MIQKIPLSDTLHFGFLSKINACGLSKTWTEVLRTPRLTQLTFEPHEPSDHESTFHVTETSVPTTPPSLTCNLCSQ